MFVKEEVVKGEVVMEEEKRVYIGNLNFNLTEEEIKKAFEEKAVAAKEVKLITDKFTGKPRGFAFAEFETAELADKAIEALNGQDLGGRALRVSKARKMSPKGDGFKGGYNRDTR